MPHTHALKFPECPIEVKDCCPCLDNGTASDYRAGVGCQGDPRPEECICRKLIQPGWMFPCKRVNNYEVEFLIDFEMEVQIQEG